MRQSRGGGDTSISIASASSTEEVTKSVSMASGSSVEGSSADGPVVAAPEGPGAAPTASARFLKSTDGLARSRVKMFGGMVVLPDAILAS